MSTASEDQIPVETVYYPVSASKFAIMSVLTFGLYELYWFYKNWAYIRERDGVKIWPFWRAVFSHLLLINFALDVRRHCEKKSISFAILILLAVLYFLAALVTRFPDPYWTISFFSFLLLLPIVSQINSLNSENMEVFVSNSSWKLRHLLLAVCSIPLLTFALAISFGPLPSTQVTSGSTLWEFQRNYLEENGIVEVDEQIIYFYSAGMFSIQNDGNLLTDQGVVTYWKDEGNDEFYLERADFGDIAKTTTEYGNSFQDTLLTVSTHDGREFDLILSTENRGDRLFQERLRKLRGE